MKVSGTFLTVLCLLATRYCSNAISSPSFSPHYCSWIAEEIVIVTEGDVVDGDLIVLESWKGDLRQGDKVVLPELAIFATEESRKLKYFPGRKQPTGAPKFVTGTRMVFFAKRASGSVAETNRVPEITSRIPQRSAYSLVDLVWVCTVWIEQDHVYGFRWISNPGPALLTFLDLSEQQLKQQVLEVTATHDALNKATNITDSTARAKEAARFTSSQFWQGKDLAFEILAGCKEGALPVLREMLKDGSNLRRHEDAVKALGKAGGLSVGPDLTAIVQEELRFWKTTAPKLRIGWWNDNEQRLEWSRVELLRDHYCKVLAALEALQKINYPNCERPVREFRDFWRSLPQLEDKDGFKQMSEACDIVLANLHR